MRSVFTFRYGSLTMNSTRTNNIGAILAVNTKLGLIDGAVLSWRAITLNGTNSRFILVY